MLRAVLAIALIGCSSSEPEPAAAPAAIEQPFDWTSVIKMRPTAAKYAISKFLGVGMSADLKAIGIETRIKNDWTERVVFYIKPKHPDGPVYRGKLPLGIEQTSTLEQLIAAVGQPADQVGDIYLMYQRGDVQVVVNFAGDHQIETVVLKRGIEY